MQNLNGGVTILDFSEYLADENLQGPWSWLYCTLFA